MKKKTETEKAPRPRAEILAELAALPLAVQGTICSYTKVRKNGKEVVYHNLQCQREGKHRSVFVPNDRLPEFEAAVENGKAARRLLHELSAADIAAIIRGPHSPPGRKNP